MKLWLLRPNPKRGKRDDPWLQKYDINYGCVVRAETEEEARKAAQEHAGEEGERVWAYKKYTTCKELKPEGPKGMIMRDFVNG